jgi:hypothetical protein
MEFETRDKNGAGNPLASGLVIDLGPFHEDDTPARRTHLAKAVQRLRRESETFRPPYLMVDLATTADLGLQVDGEPYDELAAYKDRERPEWAPEGAMARVVLACSDIVNLHNISDERFGGMSVVKCNAAVPVYRWFQAVNLMLKYSGQQGRVVPFPLDQAAQEAADGAPAQPAVTTYQMMRVSLDEFAEYHKILDFGVQTQGPERGFDTSAKFSYEILSKRGITEMSSAQVDRAVTHVMLMGDSRLRGVIVLNALADDMDATDLLDHAIHLC